jgi:iron(III) transport system substrate-binding protein
MKRQLMVLVFSSVAALVQAAEVNVYSARQEELIKPVLDKFSADTGVKVNLITGKPDELISRMASEGRNSPADVLISTDVGRLYRAQTQGLLQPVQSELLNKAIPAHLRDPQQHWFGLTLRARPIMYVPGKVDPARISTIEDLTKPEFKGRVCIRSSDNIYNQSMLAAMIASVGEAKTLEFAKGLVANFAQPPTGGDRDQIKAAAAGVCDIAIANTYYLAGMFDDAKDVAAAKAVKVLWPNQQDRGAHINISGAGVAKHAPNKAAAQQQT